MKLKVNDMEDNEKRFRLFKTEGMMTQMIQTVGCIILFLILVVLIKVFPSFGELSFMSMSAIKRCLFGFSSLFGILLIMNRVMPSPVTKADIKKMAVELEAQIKRLEEDNNSLRDQLNGVTPSDETFAQIINNTIDYLNKSPEAEIVSIRGYLLYIYRGNNTTIREAICNLSPGSPKLNSVINIYGGNNQILPNAEKAEQAGMA